jgi:hypothetical protein
MFNRIKEYHGLAGIEAAVQRSYDLSGHADSCSERARIRLDYQFIERAPTA